MLGPALLTLGKKVITNSTLFLPSATAKMMLRHEYSFLHKNIGDNDDGRKNQHGGSITGASFTDKEVI